MLAIAADLRYISRIPTVFAAIVIASGDPATATRMGALFIVAIVCHLGDLPS
jgi:hypothetical protein